MNLRWDSNNTMANSSYETRLTAGLYARHNYHDSLQARLIERIGLTPVKYVSCAGQARFCSSVKGYPEVVFVLT